MSVLIRQRLQFSEEDLKGPIVFHPKLWTWDDIEIGESITVLAPAKFVEIAIKAAGETELAVISHETSPKLRDDGRVMVLFTCTGRKRGNLERVSETIPAHLSPSGDELTLTMRMRFSKQEALSKGRRRWPFRELRPGEAVEIFGPRMFIQQVGITASGYVHPNCDRRNRFKLYPIDDDGNRKVLVWCEAQ